MLPERERSGGWPNMTFGTGGDHIVIGCVYGIKFRQFDDIGPNDRPSITELPGLTSDPIVYGGPQGWNPHFLRTRL